MELSVTADSRASTYVRTLKHNLKLNLLKKNPKPSHPSHQKVIKNTSCHWDKIVTHNRKLDLASAVLACYSPKLLLVCDYKCISI